MKKIDIKKQRLIGMEIIGLHTEKYRTLMIVLASLLMSLGIFLCVYWNYDENFAGEILDYVYLYGYIFFAAISLILIVLLILNRFKKVGTKALAISIHIYVALIIAWAVVTSVMDLGLGQPPMFYLMIITAVAGLFVVEPFFFTIISLVAFSVIMVFSTNVDYHFFQGAFRYENYINIIVFTIIVIASCFKQFTVTYQEYKAQKRLEEMSFIDELTGLLNERSYVEAVDEINHRIEQDKMEDFAVVLMDVNNLKNTNDAYGHRYGCHLVVKCGEDLPGIFPSSKLFHIGGDEFLAIVTGEDYIHLDERIKVFEQMLTYSHIEYDKKELIYSVAIGFSKFEKGDQFKDVLQRADKAMYENKAQVKEKYHIGGR